MAFLNNATIASRRAPGPTRPSPVGFSPKRFHRFSPGTSCRLSTINANGIVVSSTTGYTQDQPHADHREHGHDLQRSQAALVKLGAAASAGADTTVGRIVYSVNTVTSTLQSKTSSPQRGRQSGGERRRQRQGTVRPEYGMMARSIRGKPHRATGLLQTCLRSPLQPSSKSRAVRVAIVSAQPTVGKDGRHRGPAVDFRWRGLDDAYCRSATLPLQGCRDDGATTQRVWNAS